MCVCIHVYIAYTYICVYVHMYACIPTTCFPHNFFLRVPRCRAPGAGCNFRLDLAARLCTLHVVLLYWLWLEHGVYGLHLHAGLFFYVSFFSVRYTCFFSIAYGLSMACMPLTCMLVSFFLFLFSLA